MIWPLIPYSYNTVNDLGRSAPSPPDGDHLLGTDDTARDVLARVIYGFRLSVSFALVVTFLTSVIGIAAGAAQGYLRGRSGPDLPADHRDLEFDAEPLRHHHHIGDLSR
jgi:microcin C transport system permease protein